jgi:aspartate/methionine/tyrosine aminotransferase
MGKGEKERICKRREDYKSKLIVRLYAGTLGRTIDPIHEIIVTVGASEAIFASVQSLVGPGDEV